MTNDCRPNEPTPTPEPTTPAPDEKPPAWSDLVTHLHHHVSPDAAIGAAYAISLMLDRQTYNFDAFARALREDVVPLLRSMAAPG